MRSNTVAFNPVVAVPAKNEADRLPNLLAALAAQTWLATSNRPLDVVVVLNNCADLSAEVLAAAAHRYSSLHVDVMNVQLPPKQAHVGSARRLAMDRARAIGGPRSVLLSTDADAVPAEDWIAASVRALQAGADVVGGHIIGDKSEEALLGPAFLRRAAHHLQYAELVDLLTSVIDPIAHDPWPRHSDHTGASIAIRADVYSAIGGIPALPFREDVALVSRAVAAGFRLRHPLDVQVGVSARLQGRARGGMADALKAWLSEAAQGLPHLVESPTSVLFRLIQRRQRRSSRMPPGALIFARQLLGRIRDGKTTPSLPTVMEVEMAINHIREIIAETTDCVHVS
jgi:hypothetical protein